MKFIAAFLLSSFLGATAFAATPTTVGEKAQKLQKLMGQNARNDHYQVKSGASLEMIKQYIQLKYEGETDIINEYKYVEKAPEFSMDETVAGTVSKDVALAALGNDEMTKEQLNDARKLVEEAAAAGAVFGFDGFEQSGCAAPTMFMLIIDSNGGTVYGIDLTPCTES